MRLWSRQARCSPLWLVVGALVGSRALAADEPEISGWPESVQQQYPVFKERCSGCHTLTRVFQSKYGPEDWKGYLKKLIRQAGSGINEESARQIFSVLKQLDASHAVAPAGGEEVLPFGEGMTKPVPTAESIREFPVEYSREAREAHVEGTLLLKCVVSIEGRARDCRVIKPIPLMTEAVLAAVAKWQFAPATFQGKPVNVSMSLPIKVTAPK